MADLRALFVLVACLTTVILFKAAPISAELSMGCFGSAGACLHHNLVCPNTSRVAIEQALYGHKEWVNCTTGVIDCNDPCCKYNSTTDCFNVFVAKDVVDIYRNCSEHSCYFRTPRLIKPCSVGDRSQQNISSYSVVQYECVPEDQIIPMCGGVVSKFGNSISVIYDPRSQYRTPTQLCWCSVNNPGGTEVSIEGVDLRLDPGADCGQFLIQDGRPNGFQHNCYSASLWPNMTMASTYSSYTHVLFTGSAEFAWIRFTSTSSPLIVSCSLNGQHLPRPTTTEQTTTKTTTTTTTTSYPQNTWTPSTTKRPSPTTTTTTKVTTTTSRTTTTQPASTTTISQQPTQTETTEDTSPAGNTDITLGTGATSSSAPTGETPTESQGLVDDVTLYGALGGAVGAIALILIVVIVAVCCCSRGSSSSEGKEVKPEDPPSSINPGFANPVYDNAKTANGEALTRTVSDTGGYSALTPHYDNSQPGNSNEGYTNLTPQNDNSQPGNNEAVNEEQPLSKPTVTFQDDIVKPESVEMKENVQDGNEVASAYTKIEDPDYTSQEVTLDIEDLPPPVDEAVEDLNPSGNDLEYAETGNQLQEETGPVLQEEAQALEEAAPQSVVIDSLEDSDVRPNDADVESAQTPMVPTGIVLSSGMIRM